MTRISTPRETIAPIGVFLGAPVAHTTTCTISLVGLLRRRTPRQNPARHVLGFVARRHHAELDQRVERRPTVSSVG